MAVNVKAKSNGRFRKYEEAFSKLSNRRELLPVESLGDYVRLTGVTVTPEELDSMIPDYNLDGYVNFASVLDMLSRFQDGGKEAKELAELMALFKLFDDAESGFLYVDELKQACLLAGDAIRAKEFNHLLFVSGLAGKERLSLYEFLDVFLSLPYDPF
eukprot:TRINITY_DN1672_c0_g2_i3.p3 TRINITY_DN1672_c0_g2~~TRINITY_DN1672_c0_g2_i3.p3  ORF type:complete len:158 (+),score=66.63 TRINITY_DN1672_c0_g2_i3:954-1427(+)